MPESPCKSPQPPNLAGHVPSDQDHDKQHDGSEDPVHQAFPQAASPTTSECAGHDQSSQYIHCDQLVPTLEPTATTPGQLCGGLSSTRALRQLGQVALDFVLGLVGFGQNCGRGNRVHLD